MKPGTSFYDGNCSLEFIHHTLLYCDRTSHLFEEAKVISNPCQKGKWAASACEKAAVIRKDGEPRGLVQQ